MTYQDITDLLIFLNRLPNIQSLITYIIYFARPIGEWRCNNKFAYTIFTFELKFNVDVKYYFSKPSKQN